MIRVKGNSFVLKFERLIIIACIICEDSAGFFITNRQMIFSMIQFIFFPYYPQYFPQLALRTATVNAVTLHNWCSNAVTVSAVEVYSWQKNDVQ